MKPLISPLNDFHSFKNNLLSVYSRTRTSRFESWFHHPSTVTLGNSLNPSGPHFSLLGNVDIISWVVHSVDKAPAMCWGLPPGSSLLPQHWGTFAALMALLLIFLVWVSLLLIHFQPLMPALPACHCFHGFLTLCLQLSVTYL